jgi:hypothetical protein
MAEVKLDQGKLEAAQVAINADIIRIDKKLGLVVHTLEGDGVEGLADEVKGIKVWIAAQSVSSQQIRDNEVAHKEKHKIDRNRTLLVVISIIGSIVLLITFIATVAGWIRNSRPIRRLPVEIQGEEPADMKSGASKR